MSHASGRVACALALAVSAVLLPAPAVHAQAAPFPYRRDGSTDTWLLAGGGALGVLGLVVAGGQEPLDSLELAALDPLDVPGIDRFATENWSPGAATASDLLVWSALAAPAVYSLAEFGGDEQKTLLVAYAETVLLTNAIVQTTKAVGRTRPYAYGVHPDIPEEERTEVDAVRSFPSSHSANTFAAAVFLGTAYGKINPDSPGRGWVWAGGLAVATATAALRVAAGRHFLTDVLAGAAIGSGTAWLVLELHEEEQSANTAQVVGFTPLGPTIAWTVRF